MTNFDWKFDKNRARDAFDLAGGDMVTVEISRAEYNGPVRENAALRRQVEGLRVALDAAQGREASLSESERELRLERLGLAERLKELEADKLYTAMGRVLSDYRYQMFCDAWLSIGLAATIVHMMVATSGESDPRLAEVFCRSVLGKATGKLRGKVKK